MDDGEADKGVGEAELGEHQEERRQQRLVGDDQAEEEQEEERFLARHGEARERVAGRDGQREAEDDGQTPPPSSC